MWLLIFYSDIYAGIKSRNKLGIWVKYLKLGPKICFQAQKFFWGALPPNFCRCWGASPQIIKYVPKDWILGQIVSYLRPRPLFWSWQHC